ncbi:tRNA (guanine-N(7)-)-methyltransferase [Planctomycetes bacterium Pla163]|uniref:tRNA (guanine-N(7)-)-methyltransferase n=1 Tax=Rohdeia mirabilis TaxID=2528008 RepID=A0A518CYL7_9BACT|nr:tRNA (guanine-N(7)-)-methyltransferase [Planctomycetes bacterium Pla163]
MRLKRTLVTEPVDFAPPAVEPGRTPPRLVWNELFERPAPVELEIGSGKGTFLVQEAAARPESNFFGIEYMKKYSYYGADRCRRAGLSNVRTFAGDAVGFVTDRIPDASVRIVHVYHPDPWPKARHHKRRIVRAETLAQFERILEPGGELRVVTDHPEYAEWIAGVLATSSMPEIAYTRPASAGEDELVGTNFERKYKLRDGRPLFPFARRKQG